MKKLLLYISLMMSLGLSAQELRLGVTIGTAPIKFMKYDSAQYAPANSYFTYVEEYSGSGLIKDYKPFNALNLGGVLNFAYRKFSLNVEPQFYFQRSVYRFIEPIRLKRVIGSKGFRMPIYLTYKFFKKETSAYILLGYTAIKERYWDFQHPSEDYYFSGGEIFQNEPNFGHDHFESVLYDSRGYGNFILGFGKQFKKFNSSIRFSAPSRRYADRIQAQTWRYELTFSWLFLSTKDFTNKHPLYID